MVTQKGDNTFVVGIHGNFDQAQTGVKKMFSDTELAKEMDAAGYQFSSANSINIGRLVPQIAYYVYAYAKLYANGVIAKMRRSILWSLPVTLEISWLHFMQKYGNPGCKTDLCFK